MKKAATFCISVIVCVVVSCDILAQETEVVRTFRIDRLPLKVTIDSIMKWYPQSIVYLDEDVDGKTVSGACADCNLEKALGILLQGTSLTWVRMGNQVILRRTAAKQSQLTGTVLGTVTDSLSGEEIAGALVLVQDSAGARILRWCPTNDFGFFSIPRLGSGSYDLTIRALGYVTRTRRIDLMEGANLRCDIGIVPREIVVEQVMVEGHRTALTAVQGISRGLYIRSLPTDRNEYLLDGGKIFNPTHFGGVLSTFSPEILNDVQVVGGGLPPSYGGRMGGFVDLSLREGARDRLAGSASAGTLGSSLSLGGPVSGSSTFLLSGRQGYPDAALPYVHKGENASQQHFTEAVGKFMQRVSGNGQISFSGYYGSDSYANAVTELAESVSNAFSWRNEMANVRWIGVLTPSLFLNASLAYSGYDFDLGHFFTPDIYAAVSHPYSSRYGREEFVFRLQAEDYYDEDHTVRGGAEIFRHQIRADISNFSSQLAPYILHDYSAWEAVVYLQDQWKLLPGLSAELGARATSFLGSEGSFSGVDPRFSLRMSLDERTTLYSAVTGVNQYIHPYRSTGVFLLYPTFFWYPSTDSIRPSTALSLCLGGQREFGDAEYVASFESYYRVINNLHEFGLDTLPTPATDFASSILYGTGRMYGFVCSIQKRLGRLTGSVSYNLSWSLESFPQIDGGKEFRSPFDRRHEIQISTKYSPDVHWTFGVLCVLASGPSALIPVRELAAGRGVNAPQYADKYGLVSNASYGEYLDVNGGRLPGFQRLELQASYRTTVWTFPCQLAFRLLNSYGIVDPFVWNLVRSADIRSVWNVSVGEPSLLPRYPALSLSVRF